MAYKGSIELIGGITPKNGNKFPLVDASAINITDGTTDKYLDVYLEEMSKTVSSLNETLNTAPSLSYTDEDGFKDGDKKHWAIGDQMYLVFRFTTSTQGKVYITILRNGMSFKTVTTSKGLISVDLGKATTDGKYIYTVSASDALGRESENSLTFTQVCGGVTLTSTFEDVIKEKVFSSGKSNTFTIPASISYPESGEGYNRYIVYTIKDSSGKTEKTEEYSCGTSDWSSAVPVENYSFAKSGIYTLELTGYVTADGEKVYGEKKTFIFSVIPENTVAVAITDTNVSSSGNIDTDTLYITYRVSTNVTALLSANSMKSNYSLKKGTTVIKELTAESISSGDTLTWNIGRLSEGTYTYEISCYGNNGDSSTHQNATGSITVAESEEQSSYVSDGLVAYFDANDMDNSSADPSVWKQKDAGTNYYYIKLHELNYDTNGWIVDTDGSKMLKFTGDSYGEMRQVNNGKDTAFAPMSKMTASSLGNSLEIMYKSKCIGVTDAVVLSCRNEAIANYGGYTLSYNRARISSDQQFSEQDLCEDEWTHIVFTIDKNIRTLSGQVDYSSISDLTTSTITNSNIEDMNSVYTMNIYVNGVRTKVSSFPISGETFNNDPMQLLLNTYYDSALKTVDSFGNCEIKTIRLYDKALTASQVFSNYVNAQYDTEKRKALSNKNNDQKADIPVVRFVRNKTISGKTATFSVHSNDKSFSVLNSITLKKSDDESVATSKNSWVNCTMWYTYLDAETNNWTTVHYDDVDVYLQGTSSLQYPIKNYKIKLYKEGRTPAIKGKKLKIVPPNMVNKDGWYCEDSVFTLKCDYMEESHRNNTPTAMLYESVLDTVMEKTKEYEQTFDTTFTYTPAKETSFEDYWATYTDDSGAEQKVRKYRDAVSGFPILLYYNENADKDSAGTPIDYNTLSSDSTGYYSNTSDTMVGTLMFNVDKTGKSLGFEIDTDEYQATSPLDGRAMTYTDGTEFTLSVKPCVSLEGTSNSSAPSAAAFYTFEEANLYIYKNTYLEEIRTKSYSSVSADTFYANANNGKYSGVMTYEQYEASEDNKLYKSEYAYISSTFEPRWVYTEECLDDDKELSDDVYNELTYGNIKKTIEWIAESYNDKDKFRSEFSQHFSLPYCITYYLQMMAFIQVDNAGKNAMFDQWGDGILYPRPYDMDTQMGENNSGDDVIPTSAELNRSLSPAGITGNYKDETEVSNYAEDASHTRYTKYNTPNSKLWIAFGTYFKSEIQAVYAHLRNEGVYSVENITEFVDSVTSDIIGETFYNKDASAKYLTQTYYGYDNGVLTTINSMLTKLQGNRSSKYKRVCEERFIFLDGFFGYTTAGKTTNSTLTIRSDAAIDGVHSYKVGISVYSPCYITIAVGTDVQIIDYIDENNTYTYNEETYEGVLFTLPLKATNKDITIIGAGNIKSINHMENLVITKFECENASKMTTISITNSTALASISLGSNTYLRSLNVSGSSTLEGTIDLTNCANLKTVDISDTGVTYISLPSGGAVSSFAAKNGKLTSLKFDSLYFLKTISIAGCNNVSKYEMNNCPKITSIDVSGYINLSSLIISNCQSIASLDLSNTRLSEFSVTNCDSLKKINLSGCSGSIMSSLNLTSIYGLEELNVSSSVPEKAVKTEGTDEDVEDEDIVTDSSVIVVFLPKYAKEYSSKDSATINSLIKSGTDVYWHNLKTFTANASNLYAVCFGVTSYDAGVCDFSQLTNLSSLTLHHCTKITEVKGLVYEGAVSKMFCYCSNLAKISGKLTSNTASGTYLFYECKKLSDIESLTLNLESVTSLGYAMSAMSSLTNDMAYQVLKSAPNVTDLGALFWVSKSTVFSPSSNLFENNPNVTSASSLFRGTNITSLPEGIFDNFTKLTSLAGAIGLCTSLKTVPYTLLKKCVSLVSVRELFFADKALTTYFTDGYDIFPETNNITNANLMFCNCSALNPASVATNDSSVGLKVMLSRLPNLTTAIGMFAMTKFTTLLPEKLFTGNPELTTIDFMFGENTGITQTPSALFSGTSTTSNAKLTSARGLFSGCKNMEGNITNTLLLGAPNLEDIGAVKALKLGIGNYLHYHLGMFANTKIMGYETDFLKPLTKLKSASFLFFKGSKANNYLTTTTAPKIIPTTSGYNNDSLTHFYSGTNIFTGIYNDIFKYNTALQDASYVFAGNTSLDKFADTKGDVSSPSLFANCKSKLKTAEGIFANCTGLAIDIPKTLFNNCTALTSLKSVYAGCTSMTGSISKQIFSGCSNLQYTNYMFYGCENLGYGDAQTSDSIPSDLFDDCRSTLTNTAYMFAKCGFTGRLGVGDCTTTTITTGEGEDATYTTTYTINRHGLLSECYSLYSTEGMFAMCRTLKGAIPADMFFTPTAINQYNSLTTIAKMFDGCYMLAMTGKGTDGRNKQYIYSTDNLSTDDTGYLIPVNWIAKCPNITSIAYLFRRVAFPPSQVDDYADYTVQNFTIGDTTFSTQTKISTASYAFWGCKALNNAKLTSAFLQQSLGTLKDVSYMFTFSNLLSCGTTQYNCMFEKNTSKDAVNNVLTNISYTFYYTNSNAMTGRVMQLSKFSKISSYDHFLYNQTKLDNYSDYPDSYKQVNNGYESSTEFDSSYGVYAVSA